MKKLLVMMLLLYPLAAMAETYEWTDERGTVHFTEDLGKVPKKFRKKVKITGGDESGTPQTTIVNEGAAEKPKADEPPKGKKSYAGKDEAAWRREFAYAKREIQASEANLRELQGRLTDTSKMSRGEYLSLENTIRHEDLHLQGLRKKLDQLEQAADRAGVPKDMRE